MDKTHLVKESDHRLLSTFVHQRALLRACQSVHHAPRARRRRASADRVVRVSYATCNMQHATRQDAPKCRHGRVHVQMWETPGADSRRRCGKILAQMWAHPGADVGTSRRRCGWCLSCADRDMLRSDSRIRGYSRGEVLFMLFPQTLARLPGSSAPLW